MNCPPFGVRGAISKVGDRLVDADAAKIRLENVRQVHGPAEGLDPTPIAGTGVLMHCPDLGPSKCLLGRRSRMLTGRTPKVAGAAPPQRSPVQNEHSSGLTSLWSNSRREEMRDTCEVRELEVLVPGSREKARFIDGPNTQASCAGVFSLPIGI